MKDKRGNQSLYPNIKKCEKNPFYNRTLMVLVEQKNVVVTFFF